MEEEETINKEKQRKEIPTLDKTDVITSLCQMIDSPNPSSGKELLKKHYPFQKPDIVNRSYTKKEMLRIFLKDGFIDRYNGNKLIFPPVLRILSIKYPEEFPFHPNWKMNECHPAYWDLLPTIDHIIPIAKGGKNTKENLVCTSMSRNNAKANFTLEELDWHLYPPGNLEDWDGQLNWFMIFIENYPEFLTHPYIRSWYISYTKIEKLAKEHDVKLEN